MIKPGFKTADLKKKIIIIFQSCICGTDYKMYLDFFFNLPYKIKFCLLLLISGLKFVIVEVLYLIKNCIQEITQV